MKTRAAIGFIDVPEGWRHEFERIIDRFEDVWQQGQRPDIAQFLPQNNDRLRLAVLRELVHFDLEYRTKSGETPTSEDYLARFPELNSASGFVDSLNGMIGQLKLTKLEAEAKAKPMVLGNYILMEQIGAGGMGQVFKARHQRMDRIVAVKLLPAAMTKDKAAIARFEREVKAAAKFSHPNIVTAYDADQADGVHFLVMEFVDGSDLSVLVKRNGPVSVNQAVNFILQAAMGLEAAHKKGIVHRDIKPSNLLLDSEGVVKILDMGLARIDQSDGPVQAELTSTGTVMGTVDYMAPEQAVDSKTADARADIYALGCSLHYLLTGNPTYHGDSLVSRLLAHRDHPIPSLRAIRLEVPEQLETVFKTMIAKKVADRYQTMSEVIADLGRCPAGQPTLPPPRQSISTQVDRSGTLTLSQQMSSEQTILSTASGEAAPAKSGNGKKFMLIGGGLLGMAMLAAIIVSLRTKDGTLVVEVDQPDATVQVLDAEGVVKITKNGVSGTISISVDPGKHRLKVEKDGFDVYGREFEVKSGGKTEVIAKLIALKNMPVVGAKPALVAGVKKPLAFETPGFDQWVKEVSDMPAQKQVEAVAKKLQELNPGFDGMVTERYGNALPKIENGVVTEFGFFTDNVTDISPVRALMGLKMLRCDASGVGKGTLSDLSPLRGMKLIHLDCGWSPQITDLSPLQGMPLTGLQFGYTNVFELSPLQGLKLTSLECNNTNIFDLSPLQGMPLTSLQCQSTDVSDLSPLQGMPLRSLNCGGTQISDLLPLYGMPLTTLACNCTDVDLSPLRGTHDLTSLNFSPKTDTTGVDLIRQLSSLQSLCVDSGTRFTPDEFWKKYDAGEFGRATPVKTILTLNEPAFQQWMKDVRDLPAEEQVKEVVMKLQELNPGFDGKVWNSDFGPMIENGVVSSFGFSTMKVVDISPVRAFSELKDLSCVGEDSKGQLSDLSPLKGMRLWNLNIRENRISDLTPLAEMPLSVLSCYFNSIKDLSPLRHMPLKYLHLAGTRVSDLSPLEGMKLKSLMLEGSRIKNISVLRGMPLQRLKLESTQVSDLSPLQGMQLDALSCSSTRVSNLSPLNSRNNSSGSYS